MRAATTTSGLGGAFPGSVVVAELHGGQARHRLEAVALAGICSQVEVPGIARVLADRGGAVATGPCGGPRVGSVITVLIVVKPLLDAVD